MIDITKATAAVTQWASTDPTRTNLQSVLFAPDGKQIATNGHGLALWEPTDKADPADFPRFDGFEPAATLDAPVTINAKRVEEIIKALPKRPTISILGHALAGTGSNGKVKIGIADKETVVVCENMQEQCEFPDYTQVIPDEEAANYRSVTINASYLAMVAKSAMAINPEGNRSIKIRIPEPLLDETTGTTQVSSPVRFEVENPNTGKLTIVLMPQRE